MQVYTSAHQCYSQNLLTRWTQAIGNLFKHLNNVMIPKMYAQVKHCVTLTCDRLITSHFIDSASYLTSNIVLIRTTESIYSMSRKSKTLSS